MISMLVSGKDDGFVADVVDEDDADADADEEDLAADLGLFDDTDDTAKPSVVVKAFKTMIKAEIHSTMVLTIIMFVTVVVDA